MIDRSDPNVRRELSRWAKGVATAFGSIGFTVGATASFFEEEKLSFYDKAKNALIGAILCGGLGGALAYAGFILPH